MMTVYGTAPSGNCWKAAQILLLTGHKFRWVGVDTNGGETRTPGFLARFPLGKVPVVEMDDGTVIAESNAILAHFAEGTPWLPPPGLLRTRVFEWLFWEQYSHEPFVAAARNICSYLHTAEVEVERLGDCHTGGERALNVMEAHLSQHNWLTDAGPTIADLALFANTHVAHEGGFDLTRWPAVSAWLGQMRGLPGITPLR